MGYYSEAGLTVYETDFTNLISRAKVENKEAFQLIRSAKIYRKAEFVTLYFDNIKWYDSYEDIQFIETFMRGVPSVFKRVGEETEDIESFRNDVRDYDMPECVGIIVCLDMENAGELVAVDDEGVFCDAVHK